MDNFESDNSSRPTTNFLQFSITIENYDLSFFNPDFALLIEYGRTSRSPFLREFFFDFRPFLASTVSKMAMANRTVTKATFKFIVFAFDSV